MSANRENTCEGVKFPNSVEYELTLETTPMFCDRADSRSTHSVQVLFIGFGAVAVNISVQCSCPCESNRVSDPEY